MTTVRTPTSTDTGLGGLRLRFEYRDEPEKMTVQQAQIGLARAEKVVKAAVFAALHSSLTVDDLGIPVVPWDDGKLAEVIQATLTKTDEVMADARVERLSYASPYEIILLVTGAAGSLSVIGHRFLALHDRYIQSKVTRAQGERDIALLNEQTRRLLETSGRNKRSPDKLARKVLADVQLLEQDVATAYKDTATVEVLESGT